MKNKLFITTLCVASIMALSTNSASAQLVPGSAYKPQAKSIQDRCKMPPENATIDFFHKEALKLKVSTCLLNGITKIQSSKIQVMNGLNQFIYAELIPAQMARWIHI